MRGRRALVMLAVVWLGCGPLVALQLVAWIGMLGSYSWNSGSLAAGLEQTFDGAHPCTLCHAIAAERERPAPVVVDENGSMAKIFVEAPESPVIGSLRPLRSRAWRSASQAPPGWAAAPRPPPPRCIA